MEPPMHTLNDSLDDLLSGPIGDVRGAINAPTDYQPRDFTEVCNKCRGSGVFRSYDLAGSKINRAAVDLSFDK
jgi:hypothetical protein